MPDVDDPRATPTPGAPAVTVVVVTWQGAHLLPPCLDSLRAQTLPHRVVVVDNASTDGTAELLAASPDVQVVRSDRNRGFAGGVQLGIDAVHTEFVALLNNRHRELLAARNPIIPRRRKGPRQRTTPRRAAP